MFICYLKAIAALFVKWCIILSYQKQDEVTEEKVLQCFSKQVHKANNRI